MNAIPELQNRQAGSTIYVFLVCVVAHARPVRTWRPDELYKKADVVVIAAVERITETGKRSERQLGERNPKYKTVEYAARLHVQHIIKGNVSTKCELKYENLDPKGHVVVVNGPCLVRLAKGKVCLLYLKNTAKKDSFDTSCPS